MRKLLVLVVMVWAVCNCTNKSSNVGKSNANNTETLQSTGPDPSDLLKVLQGKWQNVQQTGNSIEFIDTRLRYYQNGNLSSESMIEIDGACSISPCAADSSEIQGGWCFVEKDNSGMQCRVIFSCDKDSLKFGNWGAEESMLVFKKEK